MTPRGLAACGAIALVLLGGIAAELRSTPDGLEPMRSHSADPAPAAPPAPRASGSDRWTATSLQRPLFEPGRRPPIIAAADRIDDGPAALPRLAGTLVTAAGRSAIFAGAGRATVVGEGARLGPWTVQSIAAGRVTLTGPEGRRVLRPAFERAAPPPAAAASEDADPTQPGFLASRSAAAVRSHK